MATTKRAKRATKDAPAETIGAQNETTAPAAETIGAQNEMTAPAAETFSVQAGIRMPSAEELRQALDEEFGPVAQMTAHHEGLRTKLYKDFAANGEDRGYAIGVGRNLTHRGLSQAESLLLYLNDLREHVADIPKHVPEFTALDPVRRAVLIDMAHTLSANGLGRFKKMRAALAEQNWLKAVYEMGDSKWFEQQPAARSALLLTMMLTGREGKDFDIDDRDQQAAFAVASRGAFQAALDKGNSGSNTPVTIAGRYKPQKPRRQPEA